MAIWAVAKAATINARGSNAALQMDREQQQELDFIALEQRNRAEILEQLESKTRDRYSGEDAQHDWDAFYKANPGLTDHRKD